MSSLREVLIIKLRQDNIVATRNDTGMLDYHKLQSDLLERKERLKFIMRLIEYYVGKKRKKTLVLSSSRPWFFVQFRFLNPMNLVKIKSLTRSKLHKKPTLIQQTKTFIRITAINI